MKLYFAPLEGFTDAVFRRVHHASFPGVHKYFMPFLSPARSLHFTAREMFDISPAQNAGVPVVPQILAKDPALFLGTARLFQNAGYTEVNLNIGCPSGTVTAKGKGAGMLRDADALARFLDRVLPLSPLQVSVKTRVGMESLAEWPGILKVLRQYPFCEVILHPRTGREQYRGSAHRELMEGLAQGAPWPVVYNGDLFTAQDGLSLAKRFPGLDGLMLGRGLTANPALAREMQGGPRLTKEDLILFHDRLYREYEKYWPQSAVIGRMHAITGYLGCCLQDAEKPLRALHKTTTPDAYQDAAAHLFQTCELKACPAFVPPQAP